ncbi:hypothetical protein F511_11210 [Dorcoceras hygrometricum]|uniref:Uncharacterized protein n=1 Tax=Dorcoceras hygrometricum TaxID=472368 RepID=A0A2Z7CYE8_9LAMI|nr:hypothetical protein F511_11210 [Dorcoceras hygrometricum]
MISGGPTDGGSNRARKARCRRMEAMEVDKRRSGPTVSFGPEDLPMDIEVHNDALVIRTMIANYEVARIFVDSGSSVNVFFKSAVDQMDLGKYRVEPMNTTMYGFTGHSLQLVGVVQLPLSLGSGEYRKTKFVEFTVVDAPYSYNVILRRPVMAVFLAMASTLHQKIKFPVGNSVGEVLGDRMARKCYVEEVRVEQKVAKSRAQDYPRARKDRGVNMVGDEFQLTTEDEEEEVVLVCNAPKIHRTTFMHSTNLLGHFGNFKCYVSAELLISAGKMRCGWFQQVTQRSDARAGF